MSVKKNSKKSSEVRRPRLKKGASVSELLRLNPSLVGGDEYEEDNQESFARKQIEDLLRAPVGLEKEYLKFISDLRITSMDQYVELFAGDTSMYVKAYINYVNSDEDLPKIDSKRLLFGDPKPHVEDRATNYSEKAYQTLDAKVEAQGRPDYVQTDEHGVAIPGYESDSHEDSDRAFVRQPDGTVKYTGFKIPYARYSEDVMGVKKVTSLVMDQEVSENVEQVLYRKGSVREIRTQRFVRTGQDKPKWAVKEEVRPMFKIYVVAGDHVQVDAHTKVGACNLDNAANNLDAKVLDDKRLRAQRMYKAYHTAMRERSSLIQTQEAEGFYYYTLRVVFGKDTYTVFSPMPKEDLADPIRKEIERKAAEKSAKWRKINEDRAAAALLRKKVNDEDMRLG